MEIHKERSISSLMSSWAVNSVLRTCEPMFAMTASSSRIGRPPGSEAAIEARLRAAPGLGDPELHALAGFIDAEGCFRLARNGASLTCNLSVAVRDDDAEILALFRDGTGLGHLRSTPARASSNPQATWRISSKLECAKLVDILDHHPLYGRKRREAKIWSAWVRRWNRELYGGPSSLRRHFQSSSMRLEAERQYYPFMSAEPVPRLRSAEAFTGFFGGFFSGDGCLTLDTAKRKARVQVHLRRDDLPLLRAFQQRLGIGRVYDHRQHSRTPTASWIVYRRRELLQAIEILDSVPLMGRKKKQYRAWRVAAMELAEADHSRRAPDSGILERARGELTTVSRYQPNTFVPSCPDPDEDARQAHIDVLRTWAAGVQGPLSCVSYAREARRHRHWPQRNTIARTFGSWHGALVAAGLGSRAARPPH